MTIQELLFHFQSLSEDDKKAFLAQALATPGGEADTPSAPAPASDGTPAEATLTGVDTKINSILYKWRKTLVLHI